jgi:hypothetical protein
VKPSKCKALHTAVNLLSEFPNIQRVHDPMCGQQEFRLLGFGVDSLRHVNNTDAGEF